ncbi:MAG: vitamin K-dependent gamma-carboxylase, partial [Planctomycetaceae bacterium]
MKSLARSAALPVDIASLVFFRIAFGLLMAMWAWDYLASGRVTALYVQPGFHFSYTLTPWVQAWPGSGMYWHFLVLLVTAVMIAVGCCYRFATLLFAIAFTYFFLIDRANYQNHYYLTMILAWSLTIMPLHRAFSLDVWRTPAIRRETIDAWCLWLTRFHIGLPYAFGGIAKLTADWLLGEPMNSMLSAEGDMPIIGPFLALPGMGLLFSYGGLLLDLAIVPLLLYKPTRLAAYVACILFHLTNASLFDIHVFPWMMIAATTIFFEPDWPKRLFAKLNGLVPAVDSPATVHVASDAVETQPLSPGRRLLFAVLLLHVVLQLLLPFRHRFYQGDPSWTERGHLFAWRMMLRGKTGGVRFYVTDREAGRTSLVGFE